MEKNLDVTKILCHSLGPLLYIEVPLYKELNPFELCKFHSARNNTIQDVVFRELAERRFLRKVLSSKTLNISIAFKPFNMFKSKGKCRGMYFRIQSFEVIL